MARAAAFAAPGHAVTFQGWNERTFRFALTYDDKCVLLELDRANPQEAHRLRVRQVLPLGANASGADAPTDASNYRRFLGDMPRIMQDLPFLDFD